MKKTTVLFSGPLMKQTCRANMILAIVILLVMILIATVLNFAASIMATDTKEGISDNTKEDLYAYMFVLASYNQATGSELSYDDFITIDDKAVYEQAFDMYNAVKDDSDEKMTVDDFEKITSEVEASDTDSEVYVKQFEYVYALADTKGCFSGEDLEPEGFMEVVLESAGMSEEDLDKMQDLDFSTYFTKIYFTVIGILPIFVLIIIVANSLIAGQVDKGSMAYILSTPTRRSAVAMTQALYLVIAPLILLAVTCFARSVSTRILYGEVDIPKMLVLYLGMYLVVEAAAGICYLCSCIFNRSSKALAVGGGITLWFFFAALLGMFGSEDMIDMGIGADSLAIFNKLTIVTLFDVDAVQTVGTSSVDTGFVFGMIILVIIAVVCYVVGGIRFCKKDLPL